MPLSIAEFEELSNLKGNVRRSVELLEVCWSCERVSECEPGIVDDGPTVWLCAECAAKTRSAAVHYPAEIAWPMGV
jgi:hypothetical protein